MIRGGRGGGFCDVKNSSHFVDVSFYFLLKGIHFSIILYTRMYDKGKPILALNEYQSAAVHTKYIAQVCTQLYSLLLRQGF
jgi:hypothetical protein